MPSYRIYLTRKTGAVETGAEILHGRLPQPGAVIDVDLMKGGGRVRARVGNYHTDRSKAGGAVVVEVSAVEI
jgi:hypothetical protein